MVLGIPTLYDPSSRGSASLHIHNHAVAVVARRRAVEGGRHGDDEVTKELFCERFTRDDRATGEPSAECA